MSRKIAWMLLPLALSVLIIFIQAPNAQPFTPVQSQAEASPTHDMAAMMLEMTGTPAMDMGGMDMGSMITGTPAMDMGGMMGYMGNEEDQALMMAHMQPVSSANLVPAPQTVGGQPLEYTLMDGVKTFELTARPYLWNILPNVSTVVWVYNGQLPGPTIHVTEGDQVRIIFNNELPEPSTVHWHGMNVPNNMDGVPFISQPPVEPGQSFTYEFTVRNPAGTYWYHSHYHDDFQIGLGLHGALIVDPLTPDPTTIPDVDVTLMFNEHRILGGMTFPSMPMGGMEPNYFSINGKSFPATQTINVRLGQRVRLRLITVGQFIHPIHLHGQHFDVVAIDGVEVPADQRRSMDTVTVAPGQHIDVEFIANELGPWMLHCHIAHHTTNNFRVGHGGMTMVLNVTE